MSVRSILETLVVKVVGDASSYNRMMRQIPATARQASRATEQAFRRSMVAMDQGFGKFASRMDAVGTRAQRRFSVAIGRGIQSAGRQLSNFSKLSRKAFLSFGEMGGRAVDAAMGKKGWRAFRDMARAVSEARWDSRFRGNMRAFARMELAMLRGTGRIGKAVATNLFTMGGSLVGGLASRGFANLDSFLGGMLNRVDRFGIKWMKRFQFYGGKAGALLSPYMLGMAAGHGLRAARRGGRIATGMAVTGATALGGFAARGGRAAMAGASFLGGRAMAGARALPGLAMRGARALPGLAMAGAGMLGRGARALPGMAMRGARALPGIASRAAGGIGRGLSMVGRGAGLAGIMAARAAVGGLSGAVTGQFIPAMGRASAAGSLWYTRFRNQVRRLGYDLGYLGRRFSLYVTAPIMAMAAASVVAFAKFNDAITTSMSLLEHVGPGTQGAMEKRVFEISAGSRTAPTDLANAYFHLASAGFEAAEAIGAIGTVEKFAIAGAFDLNESGHAAGNALYAMGRATTYLVDTMSAMGLRTADATQNMKNMEHVGNVLTKANMIANATVQDFAAALTNKAGAAARMVGKDIEEVTAVIAAFAQQGVKGAPGGEKAYIMYRDMARAAIKKAPVFESMGIKVFDNMGEMRNTADILANLEDKLGGLSDEAKRAAFMQLGFQDRSLAATMQLLGFSNVVRDFEAKLRNTGNAMDTVANRRLKSFTSQVMMTRNQVTIAAIGIGKLLEPALMKINAAVRAGVAWWNGLNTAVQKWTVYLALAVASVGIILVSLGMLATAASTAVSLFLTGSTLVMAWAPMVAIFAALGVGVLYLISYLTGAKGLVGAWQLATKWGQDFALKAVGFFENFGANIKILSTWFQDNWKNLFTDAGNIIVALFNSTIHNVQVLLPALVRMFAVTLGWISKKFQEVLHSDFVQWLAKGMIQNLKNLMDWAKHAGKIVKGAMTGKGISISTALDAAGFMLQLGKDFRTGGLTDNISNELQIIWNEAWGKLKSPLEGFDPQTKLPELLFDIQKKVEAGVEPAEAMRTVLDDLRDEMEDDPITVAFESKGVDALLYDSVEVLNMLQNLKRQPKLVKTLEEAAEATPAAVAAAAVPEPLRGGLEEVFGHKAPSGFPDAEEPVFPKGSPEDLAHRGRKAMEPEYWKRTAPPTRPIDRDPGFFNAKGIGTEGVEDILADIEENTRNQADKKAPLIIFKPADIAVQGF